MQNFARQSGFAFVIPIISSIVAAVASIASWLFVFVTVTLASFLFKVAVVILATVIQIALLLAFISAINTCVEFIGSHTPPMPDEMEIAASWFIPNNIKEFFICVISLAFIELVYKFKTRLLNLYVKAAS